MSASQKRKMESEASSPSKKPATSPLLSRFTDDDVYIGLDGKPRAMTEFEKVARAAGISANLNRLNKDALIEQLIGREVPGDWNAKTPKKSMTEALRSLMNEQGATGVKYMPVSEDIKKGDPEWILTPEQEARWQDLSSFVEEHNMSKLNRKKKRFLLECSSEQVDTFKLGIIIAESCKHMDLRRAFETYEQYKGKDIFPSFDDFSNLLSLVAGLGEQGSGVGPARETEPPQDAQACTVVFRDLQGMGFDLTENNYTAVIRCLSMNGRSEEALKLYREMRDREVVPKLRTYTHLLLALSDQGAKEECFELYRDITEKYRLCPSERDYVSMLSVCQRRGDRSQFYSVLASYMEDVLVPESGEVWSVLREWFQSSEEGFVVTESDMDTETGVLACHGHGLRSVDLDVTTRQVLLSQVHALASQREEAVVGASAAQNGGSGGDIVLGGGKGKVSRERLESMQKYRAKSRERWLQFTEWAAGVLRKTEDEGQEGACQVSTEAVQRAMQGEEVFSVHARYRYTVVIDGANVGYYKTNYAGSPTHVDFMQLDWAVQQLKIQGHRPLVMLHCRHVDPRKMPKEAVAVVAAWRAEGALYETPHGCNDDWFWLFLAVILRAKVLTNDEMRDHTFQMLSPRWFERWKERNQIHFRYGAWAPRKDTAWDGRDGDGRGKSVNADASRKKRMWRECIFDFPRKYSYRMQCLMQGSSYAFPARGKQKWLCAYRPEPA